MGKFAVVLFLTNGLVILPIVLGTRFHGYDSYKQYYDNHVNGGRLKHPITYKMTEKSYYNHNEDKDASKNNFGSLDVLQARNGDDNYSRVTHCDDIKQTFCEDVPNYPQDYVNQMLAKNSSLLHYAHEDIISIEPRLDNEEEPLCLSTERLIYPKMALNKNNEWMYIVQANDLNFRQSIRIEACKEEDAKCRIIDGFTEGYITMCKQKYIYRELSAMSANGEIIRDYFRLPASCCCHVQFKDDESAKSFPHIFRPQFMQKTYV